MTPSLCTECWVKTLHCTPGYSAKHTRVQWRSPCVQSVEWRHLIRGVEEFSQFWVQWRVSSVSCRVGKKESGNCPPLISLPFGLWKWNALKNWRNFRFIVERRTTYLWVFTEVQWQVNWRTAITNPLWSLFTGTFSEVADKQLFRWETLTRHPREFFGLPPTYSFVALPWTPINRFYNIVNF